MRPWNSVLHSRSHGKVVGVLFLVLLASANLGGPIAGIKLITGRDPWGYVRGIGTEQSTSEDPETAERFREQGLAQRERAIRMVWTGAVIGGALYLSAMIGFGLVWRSRYVGHSWVAKGGLPGADALGDHAWDDLIADRFDLVRLKCIGGLILGAGLLVYALVIKDPPFGGPG